MDCGRGGEHLLQCSSDAGLGCLKSCSVNASSFVFCGFGVLTLDWAHPSVLQQSAVIGEQTLDGLLRKQTWSRKALKFWPCYNCSV